MTPAPRSAVGYSAKPLAEKLGIRAGARLALVGAPADYSKLVTPLPANTTLGKRITPNTDIVHAFCTSKSILASTLEACVSRMRTDATIWVSWPKKASKLPTDVTEDTIRELALPLGLVDIKVCAISEIWSGLKLVLRRSRRQTAT